MTAVSDSQRLKALREMCGWVGDGSHTTVTISQDDATGTWTLKAGSTRLTASSFSGLMDKTNSHIPKPEPTPEELEAQAKRLLGIAEVWLGGKIAVPDMSPGGVLIAAMQAMTARARHPAQTPIGYIPEKVIKELTSGRYEEVNIHAKPGDEAFQRMWGKNVPVYTYPANVEALEARTAELEAKAKQSAAVMEHLEAEALRWSGLYPPSSEGRNTFVMFAQKIRDEVVKP